MRNIHKFILSLLTCFILGSQVNLMAHPGGHYNDSEHTTHKTRSWQHPKNKQIFEASFLMANNGKVYLENKKGEVLTFGVTELAAKDQQYVKNKLVYIESLNKRAGAFKQFKKARAELKKKQEKATTKESESSFWSNWGVMLVMFALGTSVLIGMYRASEAQRRWAMATAIIPMFALVYTACTKKDDATPATTTTVPANDPTTMATYFAKFSGVTTTSDNTYFYIASSGIPSHQMMVGITSWQQQVPINHSYTGSNAWSIPLQPKLADSPLSTSSNLLKGALAIAVNGIPIFNPLNNRGEDTKAIGELDNWGGHCGRADDYHYHVPPTHLETTVGTGNPIAYALDGFPVYGTTTATLDEYLGIQNADGSYQYHTTDTYPYFMAGVRGEVQVDPATTAPENQIIPQATTQGARPALTPLSGATITGFSSTGTNAYSLEYTVNSQVYKVNYSWTDAGQYIYEYVNPSGGIDSTRTYTR